MSILLETLGRGLPESLRRVFVNELPPQEEHAESIATPWASDVDDATEACLRRGVRELDRMHLVAARSAFERALQLTPGNGSALVGLACVHDELGRLDLASNWLLQAAQLRPQEPILHFATALIAERAGDPERAERHYAAALAHAPLHRAARERLAALAVHRGAWLCAIEHYQRLAQLDPGQICTRTLLAALYLRAQAPLEAIDEFQHALVIEPEPEEDAAPLDVQDGAAVLAEIERLERVVAKYPGIAAFHLRLGELLAALDEDQSALQAFETAHELQPTSLETTVKLGSQFARCGHPARAAQTMISAVQLNDRLIAAFVGLGVAQHAAHREAEAHATFDLACGLEPSTSMLFAEAARLQITAERKQRPRRRRKARGNGRVATESRVDALTEALRRHQMATMRERFNAALHYRRGLLLRHSGRRKEACHALASAVELQPLYADALCKLGIYLREVNDHVAALASFQRALSLPDETLDPLYQLALLKSSRQFESHAAQFAEQFSGTSAERAFGPAVELLVDCLGLVDRPLVAWNSLCRLRPWPAQCDPRRLPQN